MEYYVNEDYWENEAIIHLNTNWRTCPSARIREKDPKNGKWHGPYKRRDDAWSVAKATGRRDVRECKRCLG